MKPARLLLSAALMSGLIHSVALAQKAPPVTGPTITSLTPIAVEPGKTTEVTLNGTLLTGAATLWTNFASSVELTTKYKGNGTQPTQVTFSVTVPPDVAPGVYGVRVVTNTGITNVRLLAVDDLPTVRKKSGSSTPAAAQAIDFPCAVEGNCESVTSDYYKLKLAAGQRVSIEVLARRLGFNTDAVFRVIDPTGHVVCVVDDDLSTGPDGRTAFTAESEGDYLIELRDVRYQGGVNSRYRLRIGDFPIVSASYPMAVAKASGGPLTAVGSSVAGLDALTLSPPAAEAGQSTPLAIKSSGGKGSSWLAVQVAGAADQLEAEPNESSAAATAVTFPGAVGGRLEKARDHDYFVFEAKKGAHWLFTGQGRALGSPVDLYLRVLKAEGGQLAEAEDAGLEEGVLDFTAPADGKYTLVVEDVNRRGGPEFVYRVAAEPFEHDYSLAFDIDKLDVPQEGIFALKVTAARRGFNGPITLDMVGGPKGLEIKNNVIAEGKTETTLTATLPPSIKQGQYAVVSVVGVGKAKDVELRRRASNVTALRRSLAGLPYPPGSLDGTLGLGIGPVFPEFFKLAAVDSPNFNYEAGKPVKFKVKIEKSNGFDDKVTLALEGLPKDVTIKPAEIAKGQKEVSIELASAKPLDNGRYSFKLVGSATFQNQPKQIALDGLALQVGPPLTLTVQPAGALKSGGKQKLTIALKGLAAPSGEAAKDARPLKLTWKNLHPGVTAPAEAALPPDKDSVEVELSSGADSARGKLLNVTLQLSTTIDGKEVSLTSQPFEFEVQ